MLFLLGDMPLAADARPAFNGMPPYHAKACRFRAAGGQPCHFDASLAFLLGLAGAAKHDGHDGCAGSPP